MYYHHVSCLSNKLVVHRRRIFCTACDGSCGNRGVIKSTCVYRALSSVVGFPFACVGAREAGVLKAKDGQFGGWGSCRKTTRMAFLTTHTFHNRLHFDIQPCIYVFTRCLAALTELESIANYCTSTSTELHLAGLVRLRHTFT